MEHETLIRKVLGANFLQLELVKLAMDEDPGASASVTAKIKEGDVIVDVDGKGVGVVDALYSGLLDRYGREYQSLKSIQIVGFHLTLHHPDIGPGATHAIERDAKGHRCLVRKRYSAR